MRKAFTLIEVMVAVLIVSVVIAALLKMFADSVNILDLFKKQNASEQYLSFFMQNSDYGFEKDDTTLDKLISEFSVDDSLRRRLKEMKIEIDYEKTKVIDMSEIEETNGMNSIFEMGKTKLTYDNITLNINRLKLQ